MTTTHRSTVTTDRGDARPSHRPRHDPARPDRGPAPHDASTLVLDPRLQGPRRRANGGFAAGAVAGLVGGPATVRLHRPARLGRHWGLGSRVLADLFVPDGSAAERDAFAAFQRRSASREAAVAALRAAYATDVTVLATRVRAPTLVLHRRADRAVAPALGRDVAATVPGARLVELTGADHFPWRGDARAVVDAVEAFLAGRGPVSPRAASARASSGLPSPGPTTALSAREREVLTLVAQGLTDAQIAETLVLSPHTVHRHVANIRTKLGVPTRAAAAARLDASRGPA